MNRYGLNKRKSRMVSYKSESDPGTVVKIKRNVGDYSFLIIIEILCLLLFGFYLGVRNAGGVTTDKKSNNDIVNNKNELLPNVNRNENNTSYENINTHEYIESFIDFGKAVEDRINAMSLEERASLIVVTKDELSELTKTINCEIDDAISVGEQSEKIGEEISRLHDSNDLIMAVSFPPMNTDSFKDLLLFQAAIDEGVDLLFVNDNKSIAITGDNAACNVSENTVDVLRGRMGFNGTIITEVDIKNVSLCLSAGIDLLCVDDENSRTEIINKIVRDVHNGVISSDRLHNACGRCLSMLDSY